MIRSTRQHSPEKSPALLAFPMQICHVSGGLLPEIPCTWKNEKRSPKADSTYGSPGQPYSARTPDTDGTVSGESAYAELSVDMCPSPLRLDDSELEDGPLYLDTHDLQDVDSNDTTLAEMENSPSSTASMDPLPQISSSTLRIVDRLLSEIGDMKGPDALPPFKSEQQSSENGSDHNHADGGPQPDSKPSNTSERDSTRDFRHSESGNGPKLEYDKDGEDDSDGDGDDGDDHNKRSRIGGFPSVQRSRRKFACPYYKRNPSLSPISFACISPGFENVSRLKQHLSRSHGYTQEQGRELKSGQRRIPEDDQWREIYRTLFREDREALENIPSPYCDDVEEITHLEYHNAAFDRHKQENSIHQSAPSHIGQLPDITRILQGPRNNQTGAGVGINESLRTSALQSLEILESYVLARSRNVDSHRSFLLLTQNLRDYVWFDSSVRGGSDEIQLSMSDSLTDDESEEDSSLNSDSSEETTGGVGNTGTELSPSDGNSQPNSSREPGQATISTGTNSGSSSDPRRSSGSKNSRQRDNDESNDGDDKPPDPKRPRKTSACGNQRLACPYFKKNPSNPALERVCKPPGFTSFQRLKEHLIRKHDLGCHLCYKCFECFNTVRETQDHRENSCPGFGEEKLGFTPDQKAHINLISSKRKLSDVEKWKAIWRILFEYDQDAVNNIPSPYYGDRISMFADMMRSELVNQGLSHEDRAEAWQMWEGFVAFVNSRQRSNAADSRSLSSVPPSEMPSVQDEPTLNHGHSTVSHNGYTPAIRHPSVTVADTTMPANDANNGLSSHNNTSENEPAFHFIEQTQEQSSAEATTGQEFPLSIAQPPPATNEALNPFTSFNHQPGPVRRRDRHSFNDRSQVVQDNTPTNPSFSITGSNDPLWFSGSSLDNMSNVDFWNSIVNFGES